MYYKNRKKCHALKSKTNGWIGLAKVIEVKKNHARIQYGRIKLVVDNLDIGIPKYLPAKLGKKAEPDSEHESFQCPSDVETQDADTMEMGEINKVNAVDEGIYQKLSSATMLVNSRTPSGVRLRCNHHLRNHHSNCNRSFRFFVLL